MTTTTPQPQAARPSLGSDLQAGRTEARAIGSAVADITEELRALAQAEAQLAQAEVQESIAALTRGAIFGAVAAVLGLIGLVFLFRTVMAGLDAAGLQEWAAALITTVIIFVIAGILGMLAMRKFKEFSVVPKRTMQSLKEDITWAREQIKRNGA